MNEHNAEPASAEREAEFEDAALAVARNIDAAYARFKAGEAAPGQVYGIIDPDYGRIYTIVRKLAWDEGYAIGLHGSFTRDLDLIAVPWTEKPREPEHLIRRIVDATGLTDMPSNPGTKPQGRLVWTLLLPAFSDPRFVDLSVMPRAALSTQEAELRTQIRQADERGDDATRRAYAWEKVACESGDWLPDSDGFPRPSASRVREAVPPSTLGASPSGTACSGPSAPEPEVSALRVPPAGAEVTPSQLYEAIAAEFSDDGVPWSRQKGDLRRAYRTYASIINMWNRHVARGMGADADTGNPASLYNSVKRARAALAKATRNAA